MKKAILISTALLVGALCGVGAGWQLAQHTHGQFAPNSIDELEKSLSYVVTKGGHPRDASDANAYARNILAWKTVHIGQEFADLTSADRTTAVGLMKKIEANKALQLEPGSQLAAWSATARRCVLDYAARRPIEVAKCTSRGQVRNSAPART